MTFSLVSSDADRYIRMYCRFLGNGVEFEDIIRRMFSSKTLEDIDRGRFDFTSSEHMEQMIIDRLHNVIKSSLRYVHATNDTGYFGVIRNDKGPSINWSYLDLNENRFVMSDVIYAESIDELERRVTSRGSPWYVFDEELARLSRKRDLKLQKERKNVLSRVRSVKAKSKFEGMEAREKVKMKRDIYRTLQIKKSAGLGCVYNLDKMHR